MARTAVELHGCCARVSLAAALLSQHIDGVARAGSAGTKSGSRARSLVLLTPCWRPSSRTARLGDQLQLDDEVNSEIADGYATASSARRGVSVGDLSTSSVSAVPETMCSAPTAPVAPETESSETESKRKYGFMREPRDATRASRYRRFLLLKWTTLESNKSATVTCPLGADVGTKSAKMAHRTSRGRPKLPKNQAFLP